MDAINPREIIAMAVRNAGRANSYNKALFVISDLKANGYQIIHRDENHGPTRAFKLGDRVRKIKGSSWTGHVVGFYSTDLTPVGYCIESENEPGSVQIYPEAAIRAMGEKK